MTEYLPLLMFVVLLGFILIGFPVSFTLAGTAILFALIGYSLDIFYLSDFGFIPARFFGVMNNITLMAVPLFVLMGIVLEKSKLAEELLQSMESLFQGMRGGLAISIVVVGALLAAATGIVGATVITMGVLSLPTMLKRGYRKELATGTIAASGTLGQIIPPSIVLVLLGDILNVDVGDLFMGALIPGLLLVGLYCLYIFVMSWIFPNFAPAAPTDTKPSFKQIGKSLLPPLLLILLVLGSIFAGIASPTEAAACGALGAMVIALAKKRLTKKILSESLGDTVTVSAMVFMILLGAQFFGLVFRGLAGDELIQNIIENLSLSSHTVLFVVLLLIFILGFFLDFFEVCFIVLPIVSPILQNFGLNPTWLAILFAINLQTSFLTPPFGFALFYLKGVAPAEVKTAHLYKGIVPFVLIQIICLGLVIWQPDLVLWLPEKVFP